MTGLVLLATVLGAFQSQEPSAPNAEIRAEPDTVRVGEHLRLVATFPVPPGQTLFFPDTLLRTTYVETREPARWSVAGRRGDTTEVAVSYTLAVYRPGPTALPPVPVVLRSRPPAGNQRGERLEGGGFVGSWADLPRVPDFSYVRTVIEAPEIYTAPTIFEFDLMEGAAPRGAADVAGESWNPLVLGLAGLLIVGLGGMTVVGIRWIRATEEGPAEDLPTRRTSEPEWRRAVRELDRVLAQGLHRQGAVDEFYARSSHAVRRFVESFDPRWGPDLTASELVALARRRVLEGRIDSLSRVMLWSERVKFGGLRPDADEAEDDWSSLRSWVVAVGGANGDPPGKRARSASGAGGEERP